MKSSRIALAAAALIALSAIVYLRDPPWLVNVSSGFGRWETAPSGVRYRWMGGHASFFIPSDARTLDIPLRAAFDLPSDWPISATITIDDRAADRLVLTDDSWRTSRLRLPPAAGRRVRRIDIRADRTRPGNRGLQVGEVEWQKW